jgi:hypothetical protein
MVEDGIAISSDGSCMYYCPLGSCKIYSVATDVLTNHNINGLEVIANVNDEGDKGDASNGPELYSERNLYSPAMSTMQSFVVNISTSCGKPWHMILGYHGRNTFPCNRWISLCYSKSIAPPSAFQQRRKGPSSKTL